MPIVAEVAGISAIANVVSGLSQRRDRMRKAAREDRDRAADWMEATVKTLDDAVEKLRAGDVAHGACQRMLTHAGDLKAAIGGQVGEEYAEKTAAEHYEVEMFVSELAGCREPAKEIDKLDRAAGRLRADADLVRATN